ncbi:uncharacterized protein LOC132738646, partial [Ruditapes philippinarum]|uniref:uncharacterized protein LOC132738646 n=1 Tax=Ruditapes philippinarum TaxID=129788 RepID=UPI00295A9586
MAESRCTLQEDNEVSGRVKDIWCQSCLNKNKQTVADKFCSTCNEVQCTECSNVHNVLAILKTHKLVNANEAVMKQDSFDMKGLDRCNQHKNIIKFSCEDENQLCCSTCAIVDHCKCHNVVEIQKLANKIISQTSMVKEKLLATKKLAEGIITKIKTSNEKLNPDVNEIPETINQVRDEVIGMFDNLKVSIVKRTTTFHKETLTQLTINQSQIENYLTDIITRLETIDSVYRNGSSSQQFIVDNKMENEVYILSRHLNEIFKNLETVSVSFHFDKTLLLPPFQVTEYVPGQLAFKHHFVNSPVLLTPVSFIDLRKTIDDKDEPFLSGIDFLPDGRLVAVDNFNKKLLLYNERLKKVILPATICSGCLFVCTYSKNSDTLVLTDRCKLVVYIYDIKTDTRVVVKDDQVKEPRGVAVGPFDALFVCSHGTDSIVQISQTGQILSSHKIDMKFSSR